MFGHQQAWTGAHLNQATLAASPKHTTSTQKLLSSLSMFLVVATASKSISQPLLAALVDFGHSKSPPDVDTRVSTAHHDAIHRLGKDRELHPECAPSPLAATVQQNLISAFIYDC